MSNRKTSIEPNKVLEFLQKNFNKSISQVTLLEGGELSCPFAFKVGGEEYVIRIDPLFESYQKDAYAWKQFASEKLPIPEMVKLGKFDNKFYFAITKKIKGKTLDKLSQAEMEKLMPSLIAVLDEIHKTNIIDTVGYGDWDSKGKAKYATWKEYVLSVDKQNPEWKKKVSPGTVDEALLKKIYKKIVSLSTFCPEERSLLHGDFGFNNTIADGEKITAVIDWGAAKYGDFVFDIAWLDTWQDTVSYENIFRKHYEEKGIAIPHFSERITCYKLAVGYGSIIFFAESNQNDLSKWMQKEWLHKFDI